MLSDADNTSKEGVVVRILGNCLGASLKAVPEELVRFCTEWIRGAFLLG